MKLVLKSVKFFEELSEETNAFVAKLYINGKYVADAKNDGHGGSTYIYPINKDCQIILNEYEQWVKTQPKRKVEFGDEVYMFERNLENDVDDAFGQWLEVKYEKELIKQMDKGIVFGTKTQYSVITWKGWDIPKLLNNPKGVIAIKNKLSELRAKGEQILNTNLPENF
jgi:hypothetical protein